MTVTVFVILWACLSALTSLVTEAVKKFTTTDYPDNVVALIVAVATGAIVTSIYYAQTGIPFTALNVVYIVAVSILNWVGATVGYDKVKQAILQLQGNSEGDDSNE